MAFGNPVGLPQVIFILGLLGFALWKTLWIRVLISLCLIVWGAFAMPYDIKIAAPLVTVGVLLFIIGILNLLKQYRGDEKEV